MIVSMYILYSSRKQRKNEGGKWHGRESEREKVRETTSHLFLYTANLMSNTSKIPNIRFLSFIIYRMVVFVRVIIYFK